MIYKTNANDEKKEWGSLIFGIAIIVSWFLFPVGGTPLVIGLGFLFGNYLTNYYH